MKYITILLVSLLLLSCGKKTTVTGKVYNPVTGEVYEGISVSVLRDKACFSFDGCGEKVHKSTTTDEKGEFAISFIRKGKDHIVINYDKDVFYSEKGSQVFGDVTEIDVPILPFGHLQQRIRNINCFDENDRLQINQIVHKNLESYSSYNSHSYDGCFDQTYSNSRVPMGWRVWKGTVTKNNVTTPFADSVYVPEGGNVLWEIEW